MISEAADELADHTDEVENQLFDLQEHNAQMSAMHTKEKSRRLEVQEDVNVNCHSIYADLTLSCFRPWQVRFSKREQFGRQNCLMQKHKMKGPSPSV